MNTVRIVLPAMLAFACFGAGAEPQASQDVYRWKDAAGVTHYGDAAPAGTQATRVPLTTRKPATAVTAPATTLTPVATGNDARMEQAEAAARQRNCSRARANLQTLSGEAMVVDGDDISKARRMSPEAMAEAKKTAQANAEAWCDGAKP